MYSSTYPQRGNSFSQPGPMFNGQMFKIYGSILALLAAATLAISIANVVLTSQAYCDPWTDDDPTYCSNTHEPYVWTWVSSGIWGSAPIFVAGLFSMSLSNDPLRWTRLFSLLVFLSAVVFSPAVIILSAVEVWRGGASTWNFYQLGSSLMEGNILVDDSPYQAKFALPLVVTILGAIMFIMTGIITLVLCCCMQSMGISRSEDSGSSIQPIYQPSPAPSQTKDVYCPPRAQLKSTVDYQPTTGPYLATRYNGILETCSSGSGPTFGNFASRGGNGPYSGNSGYR